MHRTASGIAFLVAVVVAAVFAAPGYAAYPGKNGKIAFVSGEDASFGIYTVNPDGSGRSLLVPGGASPALSPDGKKLAYSGGPAVTIHVVNADGSGDVPLTAPDFGNDYQPSWSPDGKKIAFTRVAAELKRVFVMDADGTDETPITDGVYDDVNPAWSPAGDEIAFDRAGYGVWVINPDGSGATELVEDAYEPTWSPDAHRIAFSRLGYVDGHMAISMTDVWTVNRDGSNEHRVVQGSGAAWSPDGKKIVDTWVNEYCGFANCSQDFLYTVNPDGSGNAPLTHDTLDSAPDWQPLSAFDRYPRPGSGTPTRVPLVPAFQQCEFPNSTHVAPLELPACDPPHTESSQLTLSNDASGSAFALFQALPGNPATPADEADVHVELFASDVHTKAGTDYEGQVLLRVQMKITDTASGFGGLPATTQYLAFSAPVGCNGSIATAGGSTCSLDSSLDALVPGSAPEGALSIVSMPSIELLDAGPDGDAGESADNCPPTCGTGDEQVFLREGVYTP